MIRKISSRKVSFLLAASLLTVAVPATTQTGWGKGALFGAAGIVSCLPALESASISLRCFELLTRELMPIVEIFAPNKVKMLKQSALVHGILALGFGAISYFCLKYAYKNIFGKKNKEKKDDSIVITTIES